MSEDRKSFSVGGKSKDLFYSQAVHTRLVGNFELDQLANYIGSDDFAVRALGLLLIGREVRDLNGDEVLDKLEDLELGESEGAEILAWVQEKVLNFIEKNIKSLQSQVEKMMKPLTQSVHTLNGLEKEITSKASE